MSVHSFNKNVWDTTFIPDTELSNKNISDNQIRNSLCFHIPLISGGDKER